MPGKKRAAWDYKGRLEDMEAFLLKSNSCMEDMTKTIGNNQDRIGFLESLNKQLEGTVQVKNQQSQEVRVSSSDRETLKLQDSYVFSSVRTLRHCVKF